MLLTFGTGENFDNDLQLYELNASLALSGAWVLDYRLTHLDLDPDPEDESTVIHYLRTTYNFNPDLFVRLLVQINSSVDKENVQASMVWRIIPPFGSWQIAYQRGTSELGEASDQGDTLFVKLSWVF